MPTAAVTDFAQSHTLKVITLIHWHALKLWWKKVPWHRKAANPQLQRGVFNAHESLRGQTREGKG